MRIYIAGPLSATFQRDMYKNAERAIDTGLKLIQMGHFPFIPHMTAFLPSPFGITSEEWLAWGLEWLRQCDAILYLGPSPGADAELKLAQELGLEVFYRAEDVPDASSG